jgi:cell division protein FtsB
VLAIVVCAIALSLAYPVREYLSERRQIAQMEGQHQQISVQLQHLRTQERLLNAPAYIERQARAELHMCAPRQTCYVVIGSRPHAGSAAAARATGSSWYQRVWSSVQQADGKPAR